MPAYSTENIGYWELGAISSLIKSHTKEHQNALRAMLAFGPLVENSGTMDVELVEVVEGWKGPRRVTFSSSAELTLRGRLTIYFLTPGEFEMPGDDLLPDLEVSARSLLRRVEQAYAVLLEKPHGYAFGVMNRFDAVSVAPSAYFAALEAVR